MSDLQNVLSAAAEVQAFCLQHRWRFCFIGGLAVQRWGTPRFTQDVDMTLLTGFGGEAPFVDELLARFSGRRPDARAFALRYRTLLARTAGGVDLDIALGALPFEQGSTARATLWSATPAVSLTTCSAEDLIVHKVFAGRDRDWSDVESVLIRQHGRLDLAHVRTELAPLLELKEDTTALPRFDAMLAVIDRRLRS